MSRIPGHSAEHEATGLAEFVALMAFTMSLVALSIDAMEPLGHVAGTAAVGFVSLISLSVLLTAIVK